MLQIATVWIKYTTGNYLTNTIRPQRQCLPKANTPETQTYASQQVLGQPRPSPGSGHTLHSQLSPRR